MKMGELERRTGVHREVIRLMFREGLLPDPIRPTRNSASYSEAHVQGIKAVRELQQSTRRTLKEIKAALHGDWLTPASSPLDLERFRSLLAAKFGVAARAEVTLTTLEERLPHARHDATIFARLGILTLNGVAHSNSGSVSFEDARLLEIWAAIRAAGFVEEAGFPPDKIGFYLEAAMSVARQEAKIFLENRSVPLSEEQAAAMLHTALPLMLEFFGLLRLKCFIGEIQSQTGDVK